MDLSKAMVEQHKAEYSGIDEMLAVNRDEILRLAARHKAYNVRIFGSVARGEATPDSDVDFLVTFQPNYRLMDHIGLIHDLEKLLGRKVDVTTEATLKEYLREHVIQSAVPLDSSFPTNVRLTQLPGGLSVRDEKLYLLDIKERIQYIETDTAEGKDRFMNSRLIQDAVIRNFEVIGEAIKRLKPESILKYPHIPWSNIAGFRDFLIHHYEEVEPEKVWQYIEEDVPPLKLVIQEMLEQANTDDLPTE